MIHELKITPEHFEAVVSGKKKAEIRLNDRGYSVDDFLFLKEYSDNKLTDKYFIVQITHILNDNRYLQDGYVMLSFKPAINIKD